MDKQYFYDWHEPAKNREFQIKICSRKKIPIFNVNIEQGDVVKWSICTNCKDCSSLTK